MLHAEIDLGERKSGGQKISYRSCIKKDLKLFSINVGRNFEALDLLAQDRGMWQKLVRDSSESFIDK
jgi:hypothetical protein